MTDWVDPDSAVYPYDIVHPPGTTAEQEEVEGQVQMVSSQDNAIAAALRELDYEVTPALEVLSITPRTPADGALAVRDIFVSVDGVRSDRGRGGPADAARRDPERRGGPEAELRGAPRRQGGHRPGRHRGGHRRGRHEAAADRHPARPRVHLPVLGVGRHRREHRRAERRPDVRAGDLRHPDPRLADRRAGDRGDR